MLGTLNIAFHSKALRSLAESRNLASRKLGKEVAVIFHARLSDIEVARNPEELPLGFVPSPTSGSEFLIPLRGDYVAVFESNHTQDREVLPGSRVDWSRVNRIKLKGVEKRNG